MLFNITYLAYVEKLILKIKIIYFNAYAYNCDISFAYLIQQLSNEKYVMLGGTRC